MIDLRQGDCLEILKQLPDNSVDMGIGRPTLWHKFSVKLSGG